MDDHISSLILFLQFHMCIYNTFLTLMNSHFHALIISRNNSFSFLLLQTSYKENSPFSAIFINLPQRSTAL